MSKIGKILGVVDLKGEFGTREIGKDVTINVKTLGRGISGLAARIPKARMGLCPY